MTKQEILTEENKILKTTIYTLISSIQDELDADNGYCRLIVKQSEVEAWLKLLIEIRGEVLSKCWRDKGCPFNSNTSFSYMRCLQKDYSVNKCRTDNEENIKLKTFISDLMTKIQKSSDGLEEGFESDENYYLVVTQEDVNEWKKLIENN